MYYNYFKYCLEHKLNVFKVCWRKKQYWHAITHDLSKFGFTEFGAYARYFYGEDGVKLKNAYGEERLLHGESCVSQRYLKCKSEFDKAWQHHYTNNKHHWDHWAHTSDGLHELTHPRMMPTNYISYMVSDWEAMSLKFGGTAQEFYLQNYTKIKLHPMTRYFLEIELDLINKFGITVEPYYEFCPVGDIIKYAKFNKDLCDTILNPANKKFNLNIFDLVAPQLSSLDEKESDQNGGSKA